MANGVTLKAIGLNKSPNQLDLSPGSLTEASNVIIKRDNIVESRRGYKLYGTAMGTSSDRAKQLMTYKGRIIRHYSNKLEFDTQRVDSLGRAIFDAFAGTYLEPETGRKIRYLEFNGNFYFTTDDGIKKISATDASAFTTDSGYIMQAGGVKALDLQAALNISLGSQAGFMTQDSASSYRLVWGYNDANKNELLGVPSQSVTIYNPLLNLLLRDFDRLLEALDEVSTNSTFPSLISDGDYFSTLKVATTASANTLLTNLESLATKLDADILYADDVAVSPLQISSAAISGGVCTVTFGTGNPTQYLTSGSKITLSGFSPASGILNGTQTVASVTSTTLTFNTVASGAVTLSTPKIYSNTYGSISQPSSPSIPATNAQLVAIQTYLQDILTQLQSEPTTGSTPVISSNSQTTYISPIDLTTTANVDLTFTVPQEVTTSHFYQLYRSDIFIASDTQVLSTDVTPNDELRLVYENYPTSAEISARSITVTDITPEDFAGTFLYTNADTGEGILQANAIPPACKDLNKFKNYTFFANTRTKFSQLINLLGITNMISDYGSGSTPALTISNGTTTNTYTFVTGVRQVFTVTTVADIAGSLAGKYFTFYSANNNRAYYAYYVVSGTGVDPALSGKIGIPVYINTGETANNVAAKTSNAIASYIADFTTSVSTNVITITNVDVGVSTNAAANTSGFTVTTTVSGRGENISLKQILLSSSTSPAQAVDETARSLVRVINGQSSEIIYAFYLSGPTDVPGQMQFEARDLDTIPFYVLANNSNTGASFNPDISPKLTISSISVANPTVITTSSPHGLINQEQVMICNSNSTPSVDGLHTITYISSTQFSININVTVLGNRGGLSNSDVTLTADNLEKPNRLYYSKVNQLEAVPLLNYIDIGAQDKAILRIFPLRDSLFIYKEDGLFRVSGETAPFNQALFDSSCILLVPDSLDVANNLLYGWTTQGLSVTSESSVNILSRPIDIDILKLATPQYTNFKTKTWGMGYESDNSYVVYTVSDITDTIPTIGYRFCTLTNTWTTFDKTATCGVIDPVNDVQFLGAGDTNYLEIERKNFNRTDYADREISKTLQPSTLFGKVMRLAFVSDLAVGDVIIQEQTMTVFNYNTLLGQLDADASLSPHNYESTLTINAGADPRETLDALITKVANDPGRLAQGSYTPSADYLVYKTITGTKTISAISAGDPVVITTSSAHGLQTGRIVTISGSDSTPSIDGTYEVTVLTSTTFSIPISVTQAGTTGSFVVENDDFDDIKASFNGLITLLNVDPGVASDNFATIDNTTEFEAIIESITAGIKQITLNLSLDFLIGPLTVYKAIPTSIQYSPQTLGDPLSLKHFKEATAMFENMAFTNATLSFASDLLPAFTDVTFNGTGPGSFGNDAFGYNFFGGASNSAPLRTYIPRFAQKCRYLNIRFEHSTAREQWSLYGITLEADPLSGRAYR